MEAHSIWTLLGAGIIALFIIFYFGRGIKDTLERSREAEKDWKGLLIPIAVVVLFVIFLIMMVKK